MRVIVADCSAEYSGRLNASLPLAKRVLLIKADSSLLIFSELGSYKPLNWMTAPCTIREIDPAAKSGKVSLVGLWMVILRRIPRKVSPLVSRKRCYVSAPTRVRTFLK